MTVDITQVVLAVIGLLSVILTSVVVPLVKAKLSREQWNTLMVYTTAGVQAAEIIFGAGRGKEKLEWVTRYIEEECAARKIKVDMQSIHVAIENAWKNLDLNRKEQPYGDGQRNSLQ